jgi:Mg2+ and Co2+ transporter CorA
MSQKYSTIVEKLADDIVGDVIEKQANFAEGLKNIGKTITGQHIRDVGNAIKGTESDMNEARRILRNSKKTVGFFKKRRVPLTPQEIEGKLSVFKDKINNLNKVKDAEVKKTVITDGILAGGATAGGYAYKKNKDKKKAPYLY